MYQIVITLLCEWDNVIELKVTDELGFTVPLK